MQKDAEPVKKKSWSAAIRLPAAVKPDLKPASALPAGSWRNEAATGLSKDRLQKDFRYLNSRWTSLRTSKSSQELRMDFVEQHLYDCSLEPKGSTTGTEVQKMNI